ncbi:MAG: hypothetical protein HOI95_28090 [Chromatiales bacterium]|mgnify:CR=1 FL=1|jgi:acetyl-CoA carboxylase biotin carboxyl carrier protein|nr:hypothetical protein [Chromatiales bacterium]
MPIKLEDVKTAMEIIDRTEGSEINLQFGDVTLIVRRGNAVAPPVMSTAAATAEVASSTEPQAVLNGAPPSATAIALGAPLTGVIYRAPSPEEPPFVEVGTAVTDEDSVCIIDVMKVMNLIKSPATGTVARIDVDNGQLVNRGDAVLWIEPS